MRNSRFLLPITFALALLCPGCRAQATPPAGKPLDRRIEVLIRSQMNIPPEYDIAVGARSKSEFAGYDKLAVTFSHNNATRTLDFLISTDNRTLIRMDKMDLAQDPATMIDIAGRPFRGNKDAKVTIVNFDDLECPFCARMHHELFPETMNRYGDKIKIVYKDFPLVELHPWALHAAVDANCLATQNDAAYWAYVDTVHDRSEEISGPSNARSSQSAADDSLDKIAIEIGKKHTVNESQLRTCLSAQDTSRVKSAIAEGTALGVDATPTLYINGERVSGAEGTDVLWPVIDRALTDAGVSPPPPAQGQPAVAQPQGK